MQTINDFEFYKSKDGGYHILDNKGIKIAAYIVKSDSIYFFKNFPLMVRTLTKLLIAVEDFKKLNNIQSL